MKGKARCENCGSEFEWKRFRGQTKARFCNKKCWYEWNGGKFASFNETRFQWKTATEEEKMNRLKMNYESKVIKHQNCWDWKGVFDKDGYGLVPSGYHSQSKAHRVSYMIHKGEIPKGILVCHTCDNRKCTNPEHLFLGTHKDNDSDCRKKNRASIGSKQPKAKLSEEGVKKIRDLLRLGVKARRIAKDFGVSPSQICAINKGKSWKHVV